MAGIDTEVLPGWLVGGAFGYAHTTLSAQNLASTGHADNYAFVLYSGVTRDSSYLNGAVGYIRNDGSLQRGLDLGGAPRTARGSLGANQVFGSVEAGHQWPIAFGGSVTPFVRLDVTSLQANGFSESGAGDFGLAVGSQNATSVQSVLGLKFTRDFDVGWGAPLAVSVKSGWGHEFESGVNPVTAAFEGAALTPFTVQAAHLDHDVAVVGVGVAWARSASTSLFAKFDGQYGGLSRVSTATAGLTVSW
jgi:outer membrane autotransporter protein